MTEPREERFNFNHVALAARASDFSLLTTNWDLLLEHTATKLGLSVHRIIFGKNQIERTDWGQGDISIVKLHGSVDVPPSLVTTVDQAGRNSQTSIRK